MLYDVEVLLSDGAVEVMEILAASEYAAEELAIQEALERQQQPASARIAE